MITSIKLVYSAVKKVLVEKNYLLLALLMAAFFFGVFIFIPLVTIPGNDLRFQLSIYSRENYILMVSFALLIGITFMMRIYAARKQKVLRKSLPPVLQGTVLSGASGIFGSIVGTASCASCLASLFGFIGLGTGSVFFVLKNQSYFLLGAIALILVSLYSALRQNPAIHRGDELKQRCLPPLAVRRQRLCRRREVKPCLLRRGECHFSARKINNVCTFVLKLFC